MVPEVPSWMPSAINRADSPTRDRDVEGRDVSLPAWWQELCEGNAVGFDGWLAQLADELPAARDSYNFEELGYKYTLKVLTGKQVRTKRQIGNNAQEGA